MTGETNVVVEADGGMTALAVIAKLANVDRMANIERVASVDQVANVDRVASVDRVAAVDRVANVDRMVAGIPFLEGRVVAVSLAGRVPPNGAVHSEVLNSLEKLTLPRSP